MYKELNLEIRPCFRMIISHQDGKKMEENFSKMYPDFSQKVDYKFITIDIVKFKNFLKTLKIISHKITGFRIYLGMDDNNNLVFVFNGLEGKDDVTVFFMFKQGGFLVPITWDEASHIVTSYQENVLPYTNTIVNDNTTSYSFTNNLIDDFINELEFHTSESPINRIRIKLGAYVVENDNKNRIMIGFAFVTKAGEEIGLEEIQGNFGCRIVENQVIGADTGSPCPPQANCGVTSLPKP